MSFPTGRKSGLAVERHMVEETSRDDVRLFIVLPSLEELLGQPGFGHRNPIFLPGCRRPLDGWAIFGSVRERGIVLH
jgi:hypothetical protein